MRTLTAVLLVALAAIAHPAHAKPTGAQVARRSKCAFVWRWVAPDHYSRVLSDFFVDEHERHGIGEEWFASLVYSYSGSDLNPRMVCSGGGMTACGICDGTELCIGQAEALRRFGTTDRANSWVSIASHVQQMADLHGETGEVGFALLRNVFLPSQPDGARAWQEQTGRWEPISERFQRILAYGYRHGKL